MGRMTAVTKASWAKQIECNPDSGDFPAGTRKCCWWGRGAIQTTGPANYGLLNKNIVKKASLPEIAGVDLCQDPEAICRPQYPSLKWICAIEYWVRVVQGFSEFTTDLDAFVNNGFVDSSHIGFNKGAGSAVNNGQWNGHAHAESNRQEIFEALIAALKAGGMTGGAPGSVGGGSTGTGGSSSGNCCGADWASSVNGQECPSGVDSECPSGQACFAGHTSCGATSTPVVDPSPSPSLLPSPSPASAMGGCTGEPCESASHCRSEWGFCGSSSGHCNDKSTWSRSCSQSVPSAEATQDPTPNPTMSPTKASTPAPSVMPTSAPTVTTTVVPTAVPTPVQTITTTTTRTTTTTQTTTGEPRGQSFFRTMWWPGCGCGEVQWSTPYKSKASCEAALC